MEYLPAWTKTGSWTLGRDPLGMQATSVRLYRNLIPGLTNVTNRLRYYSFYTWIVALYEKKKHIKSDAEWKQFIRRAEALYALACYLVDSGGSLGMAGGIWAAKEKRNFTGDVFDLVPHTNKPGQPNQYLKAARGNFGQFYIASMIEVGLLVKTSSAIPLVNESFGKKVADAFEKAIGPAAALIEEGIEKGTISRANLIQIGNLAHPSRIQDGTEERDLLITYLLAQGLEDSGGSIRRSSAWLVLDLIKRGLAKDDHASFRKVFYSRTLPDGAPYPINGGIIDRWRAYQANEFCHIALECLLNGLLKLQLTTCPYGETPQDLAHRFLKSFLPHPITLKEFCTSVTLEESGGEENLSENILRSISHETYAGDPAAVVNALKLIGILWGRWSAPEKGVRTIVAQYAGDGGKSLAGVFTTIENNLEKPAIEAFYEIIRRHVIVDHLAIAGRKLSSSGTFTYHFTLADGVLSDGRIGEYGYTNPRLGNLVQFLTDVGLCKDGALTKDGERFLHDAQPI